MLHGSRRKLVMHESRLAITRPSTYNLRLDAFQSFQASGTCLDIFSLEIKLNPVNIGSGASWDGSDGLRGDREVLLGLGPVDLRTIDINLGNIRIIGLFRGVLELYRRNLRRALLCRRLCVLRLFSWHPSLGIIPSLYRVLNGWLAFYRCIDLLGNALRDLLWQFCFVLGYGRFRFIGRVRILFGIGELDWWRYNGRFESFFRALYWLRGRLVRFLYSIEVGYPCPRVLREAIQQKNHDHSDYGIKSATSTERKHCDESLLAEARLSRFGRSVSGQIGS
jgi:hypothetical protein